MTSIPSSARRLDRMTASGPCSARTWASAARMLSAMYLLIFIGTSLNQSNSSTSDRGNDANAAIFGYLVVGEHGEQRCRIAHQPGHPEPDLRSDQEHGGLSRRLLAPGAVRHRVL